MGEVWTWGCAKGRGQVDGSSQSKRTVGWTFSGVGFREAMRMGWVGARREARWEAVLPLDPVMKMVMLFVSFDVLLMLEYWKSNGV